jgi:transglutaminase-like putative cysteine protease
MTLRRIGSNPLSRSSSILARCDSMRREAARVLTGRVFRFLVAISVATCAIALSARGATDPAAPIPANRGWSEFALSYVVRVAPAPGAHNVRVSIPLPSSDDYQTISELQIEAPAKVRTLKDKDGDEVAFLTVDSSRRQAPFEVRVMFNVIRYEHRIDMATAIDPPGAFPKDVAPFLQPDKSDSLEGDFAGISREQTLGAASPLDKARIIYEYVVSTMGKNLDATGECQAASPGAAKSLPHTCTDFDSMFVAMARAAGIPARIQEGFSLPQGQTEGIISRGHGWAEFYANGVGWIPVDLSQASQESDHRDDFFGAIDARRVMITMGHGSSSVTGAKQQSSESAVYPQVQVDGKNSPDYSLELFFDQGKSTTSRFVVVRKPIYASGSWVIESKSPHFPA